jgi:hypothetical protein
MSKRKGEEEESDGTPAGESGESGSSRDEEAGDEANIGPVRDKIGEGPDNLRRRGEWYRRRTGGTS